MALTRAEISKRHRCRTGRIYPVEVDDVLLARLIEQQRLSAADALDREKVAGVIAEIVKSTVTGHAARRIDDAMSGVGFGDDHKRR